MRRQHYLVYAELVWLPPSIPPNHGRVHDQAAWFLSGFPGKETGIFRLSDFPDRYWAIRRAEQIVPRLEPPRPTMTDRTMPAYPCQAIVSSDELAALLDQGYVVDVYEGPHWSRDEAHRSLDLFWEGADPRPIRWPSDPLGLEELAPRRSARRYYRLGHEAAVVDGPLALLHQDGRRVPIRRSMVEAEGVEISEAEFDQLMNNPNVRCNDGT